MATLSDEQLRALRFLARHPGGCTGATLLEQLSQLVYAGLAKLRAVGRPKLFRVKITEAGQRAIAAGVDWSSRARHPVVGVRTTAGRENCPLVAGRRLPARDLSLLPQYHAARVSMETSHKRRRGGRGSGRGRVATWIAGSGLTPLVAVQDR
jgi:hypothetical protein